jgi:Brp/Blh family beta-carotene 15,15'-monooxygenase
MKSGSVRVFENTRTFSTVAAVVATALSLVFANTISEKNLGWQIALATLALAIGIPHGAIDHLITLPKNAWKIMALFITGYVLIAVLAGAAIFQWNVIGFQLVLIMSFLHFGFGDTTFLSELRALNGSPSSNRLTQFTYAISAGAIPVLLPLTSDKTESALRKIHPSIVGWAHGYAATIRTTVIICGAITLLILLVNKLWRDVADIFALFALAIWAPPLVAFAIYFGCWHAMRHTARLTVLLPRARDFADKDKPGRSFLAAVIPGLPALIGTLLLAVLFVLLWRENFADRYLWNLLVIVWALTVPHMLATARIDLRALKK